MAAQDFNQQAATTEAQRLGLLLIGALMTPKDGAAGNAALPEKCAGLIAAGADIETRDTQGRTPVMWAARNFRTRLLQMLIDKGAYIDARDDAGMNATDHARAKKQKPAIAMLAAAKAALPPVEVALPVPAKVFRRPPALRRP